MIKNNASKIGRGLVIIGTQFGDEGKGKIVDYYTSKSWIQAVVRFNGGANAGHTIIAQGIKYALHLLPSGLIYEKPSYIGNGVVIDLRQLNQELYSLEKKKGRKLSNLLKISERAHLVLPHHIDLDVYQEELKNESGTMVGTTKRGIGPAYTDKISRFGIRVIDLWDNKRINTILKLMTQYYNSFRHFDSELHTLDHYNAELHQFKEQIESMIIDVGHHLDQLFQQGANILFEGAQATLLDIDHGLYPFGTSSTCVVAGASSGTGVGIQYLNERVGVVKAYVSRVGGGPLMGELKTTINPGKFIQTEGVEFGTTTGRPRRIAWLDLVALKYACRLNSLTGLAITKLDIVGSLDLFKVICAYRHKETNQELTSSFPSKISEFDDYIPVTKNFTGWNKKSKEKWLKIIENGWNDFPIELKTFVKYIETETKIPVVLISLGPDREISFELHPLEQNFI